MKVALLLCFVFLAYSVPTALAGLDLTAVACNSNTSPVSSSTFNLDCAAAATPQTLFACFQLPTTEDSVMAVDNVFDLSVGDAGLPDWWHFETGGCNSMTSLGHATVFADLARSTTLCIGATDFWGTGGAPAPVAFTPQTSWPNTGRFSLSISRPTPVTLRATTNYFAFNLNFLSDNATQSGGKCAGCGIGACLVWNTASVINIRAGGAGTPYVVSGPGLKGNTLWWGDGTPNCSTDPVKNRTWGQLKSFYR